MCGSLSELMLRGSKGIRCVFELVAYMGIWSSNDDAEQTYVIVQSLLPTQTKDHNAL